MGRFAALLKSRAVTHAASRLRALGPPPILLPRGEMGSAAMSQPQTTFEPRDRSATMTAFPLLVVFALAAGCSGSGRNAHGGGDGGSDAGAGEPWQLVFEHLSGSLMSVDGTGPDDVWAVGADTRDGKGAQVLRFDGTQWTREDAGVQADLWWVHVFGPSSVMLGGTKGTIVRYDGSSFTQQDTPAMRTVYGIWGASEDDVWAVGGEPDAEPGFVWRYDGSSWTDQSDMLPSEVKGTSLFKVWGRSADDVWIVGVDGVAVHWDGSQLQAADSDSQERLFTVHGGPSGEQLVAVGGDAGGIIVEYDGTTWHKVTPNPTPTQLFGVFMTGTNRGFAVGYDGIVLQRDATAWKVLDTGVELSNPLHAVWVDSAGGFWAVGGDINSGPAPVDGMLLHRGMKVSHEIAP